MLFVVLAGTAMCAAISYLYFWQIRPMGHGPAGPHIPDETFAQAWSEKQVWFIGIGDSVTAGFGARHGYSYYDRLLKNPPNEIANMQGKCLSSVFRHLNFTNLAVSGSTSGEHVRQQLSRLPSNTSNSIGLIVITTGGNDLIHNYGRTAPREEAAYGATVDEAAPWITNFQARLDSMVQQITNRFPAGYHIFLCTIFDPTDSVGDIQNAGLPAWRDGSRILSAYNDVIRDSARRHKCVHVVEVHDALLGHGIHCTKFWLPHYDRKDPHYWYYTNLEDPNERGYDAIRRLMLIRMAEVISEARKSAGTL
jgi:lysophospholipase L1-like esterase